MNKIKQALIMTVMGVWLSANFIAPRFVFCRNLVSLMPEYFIGISFLWALLVVCIALFTKTKPVVSVKTIFIIAGVAVAFPVIINAMHLEKYRQFRDCILVVFFITVCFKLKFIKSRKK